jgi:hemerythrin-like domain-containing protein
MNNVSNSRREFIKRAGIFVAAASTVGDPGQLSAAEKKEEEVSPPEDLMREHGVLKRILLIYGEAIRRLTADQKLPVEVVLEAAKIIRSFVEDYHEKLEENYLFPRFEKAEKLPDLTRILREQHQAGRRVTDLTMSLATQSMLKHEAERAKFVESLHQFIRMYNPHEAREDTVLFPAFRALVSGHEFDSLGEEFEKKENELFGEDGFERMVDKVAGLEKKLGIYELAQFTPTIAGL